MLSCHFSNAKGAFISLYSACYTCGSVVASMHSEDLDLFMSAFNTEIQTQMFMFKSDSGIGWWLIDNMSSCPFLLTLTISVITKNLEYLKKYLHMLQF